MRPYSRVLSSTTIIIYLLLAAGCSVAFPVATRPPVPTPTLATAISQDKAIELAIGGCRIPHLVLVGDPENIRTQLMSLGQADQLTRTINETNSYSQPVDTWVWLVKMDGLLQIVGGPPQRQDETAEPPTPPPFWGTCTVIVDASTGDVITVRGQAAAPPPK